jgi:cytosine/adenosine deaminase-related metal-dependent hydrolase/ubiquinone/menaquinone biosynthesis C-methylase UbiE
MATSAPRPSTNSEIYRLWSEVYDEQPNPLLSLEGRIVKSLLPEVAGRDVLDLGCGTGRWLVRLSQKSPATLRGVDVSAEMLERAALKLGRRAKLYEADCSTVPLPGDSADLVLASFLVSHLTDLRPFSRQLARILRPGGSAFISDIHPGTVQALGWSRSFRSHRGVVHLGTENWATSFLVSTFEQAGFEITTHVEARFGPPELELLRRSGRCSVTEAAQNHPAIYVLQLRKKRERTPLFGAVRSARVDALIGGNVALTADDKVPAHLGLEHRVELITISPKTSQSVSPNTIDVAGYTLLPGLINSHDHLEFALFPRLGRGNYNSFTEWYEDIHRTERETIALHRSIPKSTRLWWGALRNLLGGVTTVCHHNPLTGDMMSEDFPVRVVRHLGWAHSVALDKTFATRHHRTPHDRPFIIHVGEGTDDASRKEFTDINDAGVLDHRTVIVHGLACGPEAARQINRQNASLIWCPSSNVFLFGRTHHSEALRGFNNVALGSDSPLTGTGDLLDEIRFAGTQTAISADELYRLTTTDAGRILRLQSGAGQIRVGATADIIAVRGSDSTPARTLASLSYRDVHLVLRAGRIQLASPELMNRIPEHLSRGLRPLEIDGLIRWVRAPLGRMFRDVAPALGCEVFLNGRRVRNVVTDWL